MVALGGEEYLRLVLESAKRFAMQYLVAVALKLAAQFARLALALSAA